MLVLPPLVGSTAQAVEPLGELEEVGQVERLPTGESRRKDPPSRKPSDEEPAEADAGLLDEAHPDEAQEILPGSEAVDETIAVEEPVAEKSPEALGELEEAGEVERLPAGESRGKDSPSRKPSDEESAEADAGLRHSADEAHPDEAQEILPDSEAVDQTIDRDETEGADEAAALEKKAAAEPTAPAPEPQWSIRWQNAFIVERVDDPRYQFLFGGRVQNDWGVYAPDGDLEDSFGGDGTGTKFRRARLYFQGQFFRLGFFKVEYDFASGDDDGTDFADVYAGVSLPRIGLLRVGHYKEPFSLQTLNNSNFMSFNERAGIQALSPQRNTGIMLNGNLFRRDSTYAISFSRRTDDVGDGFSNKEDYHLTARLTQVPWFEDGGKRLLHVEFGYSHQFADKNEGTRYRAAAANDFAPNLVDTGTLAANDVELFNLGFALVQRSLSLQSEATLSLVHGGISDEPVFFGVYAQLSWWLTGENRSYLRGRGVFSRVVPNDRFDPEEGRWGAFEVAARYSWLDLSNDGIRGGWLSEWTLAFNWVLFSNLRMSNNYVISQTGDRPGTESGIAHSWVTRFQVDF
jgi:phosphate-selective porin OprO/OprP